MPCTGAPWTSGAKSALISALSLCLLLRTDALAWAAVAAALAVGSKFLVRVRGKHVFNPTNLALAALLLATPEVWVSPGQWGTGASFAFAIACAGLAVTYRSARSDVTLAFIAAYAGLITARSLYLGEPLTIPLHRLESGAFLLFSFFMISDPKTTPDARAGRIAFALLVAVGAAYVHLRLFRPNGFLWALVLASPLVPLIDLVFPAARYQWPSLPSRLLSPLTRFHWRTPMIRKTAVFLLALAALTHASPALAFCGFYVAKADTKIFNKASQVVLVRDGDRTVITMANDFRGDPREFAMVIPVPTSITARADPRGRTVAAHPSRRLHGAAAGRVLRRRSVRALRPHDGTHDADGRGGRRAVGVARDERRAKNLGVTIEARYTVGEYDILILSAAQSSGLETWLRESGYRIPAGASAVLGSYISQNMRFFVAKVNLTEQSKLGFATLRPIQVAYESPKFMLPIRLGMVNADGAQELFVYALTRKGRVESTNYRTVKLRTDVEIPAYVKDPAEFAKMYRAMFDDHVRRENMSAVFQEYAWDMAWCDPCAADPLSADELRQLGVFWQDDLAGVTQRGSAPHAHTGAGRRVRDAAARALRPGALPRRPRVPRNRRPHQLPGPLRAAPRLHRAGHLRGGRDVSPRAGAAARARARRRWRRSPAGTSRTSGGSQGVGPVAPPPGRPPRCPWRGGGSSGSSEARGPVLVRRFPGVGCSRTSTGAAMSKTLTRRQFVQSSTAAASVALGAAPAFGQAPAVRTGGVRPVVIASDNGNVYKNGGTKTSVQLAFEMMTSGGKDVLDSLVAGVNLCELDPEESGVGYGGLPNADGVVQLDSCCMHGPTKRAGGVAAIEGVRAPSLVAKAVLEQTDHHLLVGKGAQDFARSMGFTIEADLNTEKSRRLWLEWKRRVDPEHYLDPEEARSRRADGRPEHGEGRPDRPQPLLGHDQLRRHQRQGRDLRRDHHERHGLEDPRTRGRLAHSRRRPLRGQRGGRGRLHRPRRGESLRPQLVPDRRADARRQVAQRRRHGSTAPHQGQHRREAAAEQGRQSGVQHQLLHVRQDRRVRRRVDVHGQVRGVHGEWSGDAHVRGAAAGRRHRLGAANGASDGYFFGIVQK